MTLNALNIDPRRAWKGPWRWFSEDMLDCCLSLETIKQKGIDMDRFVCLARCNSAAAEMNRAPPLQELKAGAALPLPHPSAAPQAVLSSSFSTSTSSADSSLISLSSSTAQLQRKSSPGLLTEADFRAAVIHASQQSQGEFMVLSYSRKGLGQTGDGHFSPLGGYNSKKDMLLVLDVARFKYPPHWVPLPVMWRAMKFSDAETGQPRGFIRLKLMAAAPLLLFHITPPAPAELAAALAGGGGGGGAAGADGGSGNGSCRNRRVHEALHSALAACKKTLISGHLPPSSPVAASTQAAVGDTTASAPLLDAMASDPTLLQRAVQLFTSTFESSHHTHTHSHSYSHPASASHSHGHGHHADGKEHSSSSTTSSGNDARKFVEAAVAAGALLMQDATASSSPSSFSSPSSSLPGAGEATAPMHMEQEEEEDERCIDKVSKEHILATSELLRLLEATQLYQAVDKSLKALQEGHHGSSKAGSRAGSRSSSPARSSGVTGTAAMAAGSEKDSSEANSGTSNSSSTSSSLTEAIALVKMVAVGEGTSSSAGVAAAQLAGQEGKEGGSSTDRRSSVSSSSTSNNCSNCGVSCIRLRKAHVLTMLMMAWATSKRTSWGGGAEGGFSVPPCCAVPATAATDAAAGAATGAAESSACGSSSCSSSSCSSSSCSSSSSSDVLSHTSSVPSSTHSCGSHSCGASHSHSHSHQPSQQLHTSSSTGSTGSLCTVDRSLSFAALLTNAVDACLDRSPSLLLQEALAINEQLRSGCDCLLNDN